MLELTKPFTNCSEADLTFAFKKSALNAISSTFVIILYELVDFNSEVKDRTWVFKVSVPLLLYSSKIKLADIGITPLKIAAGYHLNLSRYPLKVSYEAGSPILILSKILATVRKED